MSNLWIKLTDGEPNVDEPVLVLMKNGEYRVACLRVTARVGIREFCQWEIATDESHASDVYMSYKSITHWQPLPAPQRPTMAETNYDITDDATYCRAVSEVFQAVNGEWLNDNLEFFKEVAAETIHRLKVAEGKECVDV